MRLLIAEDQAMLRDALCQLLELEDQVESVHPAKNGQEAMEIIGRQTIDIALLDIEMPYASGLDVLEWSKAHHPEVKVLIFTTFKRPSAPSKPMSMPSSSRSDLSMPSWKPWKTS